MLSLRLGSRLRFLLVLALAATAIFILGPQSVDPDLFWHLRVAELIEAGGPRPLIDTFSYNSTPEPWIPYSWLAELGMRRGVASLGPAALFLLPLLCYVATVLLVALIVAGRAGPSLKGGSIVAIFAALALPFIGLRPATFAFPLCAYAVWAVTRTGEGQRRWPALIAVVPITALSANLHLYFLFIPAVLGAWALGSWFQGTAAAKREAMAYAALAGLSLILALAANPFGPQLLDVVIHYMTRDVMVKEAAIVEMQPFYRLGPLVLIGSLLLVAWPAVGLLRSRATVDRRDVALMILALALLLALGRYVPLAALLLAPLAARYGGWPRFAPLTARRLRAVAAGAVLGLAVYAGQTMLGRSLAGELTPYLESQTGYPVAAARFVRDSVPREGVRLVNEMGWGGYLIYALWPEYQVMMDGRTQVYPEALWRAAYVNASADSRLQLVRRARADAAVLRRGSAWADVLAGEPGWQRVYTDSIATVWINRAARPRSGAAPPGPPQPASSGSQGT